MGSFAVSLSFALALGISEGAFAVGFLVNRFCTTLLTSGDSFLGLVVSFMVPRDHS